MSKEPKSAQAPEGVGMKGKRFCVYAHSVGGAVFYIGKGSSRRPFSMSARTKLWRDVLLGFVKVRILKRFDSEDDALEFESTQIKLRKPAANCRMENRRGGYRPKPAAQRKKPGRKPVIVPCGWCKLPLQMGQYMKHVAHCPKRPGVTHA